ncbi:hypothetical protein SHAb15599_00030 [Acinetobacter phage SH-Ab 15599]|nr:hypothetical protein SHAb15599_00030 [Acinetobacter phage SH-Ab 15599]
MSVQDLKNAVKSGLYRNHKFRILFNFPEFAGTADVVKQAAILARSSKTPASTLGVIEVPFEGRTVPLPGDRQFEEFTVTLLAVNDFKVRNTLEIWSEAMNGSESNTTTSLDYTDFLRDITVELLNINDQVIKTYTLQDAWPNLLEGVDLDRGAMDNSSEFNISLRYLQYVSDTTR